MGSRGRAGRWRGGLGREKWYWKKDIYGRNKQKEFTAVELTNVLYIIKFEPGQLVPWKKYVKHFNTQENKMH